MTEPKYKKGYKPGERKRPSHGFRPHKYSAKKTEVDGILFPSKKQAAYYVKLKLAQRSGELLFFLREVPFDLVGGTKYWVDFQEFWKDGQIRFVDVKGFRTKDYILKKKQVEALYPITIEEE